MIFEFAEILFLKRLFTALSMSGAALLILPSCSKSPVAPRNQLEQRPSQLAPASIRSASAVLIDYPSKDEADPLDLRSCSLSGVYAKMPCRLIGTSGPVRKIAWMDNTTNVVEASIEFDRDGSLQRICRRGHVDFQTWHCSDRPFSTGYVMAQTKLDDRGRIIQRQNSQFDATRLDTCLYDDVTLPRSSECIVDGFSLTFTFDQTGRALTYSVRRIPIKGEPDETTISLGRAYALDLTFTYKNDSHGNWTEFEVTGKDRDSGLITRYARQTLSIEYY